MIFGLVFTRTYFTTTLTEEHIFVLQHFIINVSRQRKLYLCKYDNIHCTVDINPYTVKRGEHGELLIMPANSRWGITRR